MRWANNLPITCPALFIESIMSIPLQNILNEAIGSQRQDKREITSWHVSKIGSCMRGMYLERLGVEPDIGFDERTLRVFSCGRIFENWFVDLLRNRWDIKIETQPRVENKELGVSGYADFVAEYGGIKKVYEVKSKHSKAFWWMKKEGKPMRQHEYQLWLYLYLLKIEQGLIIYLSKDDLSILEYPVELNDKELEKEVMEQLELLNRAWREKDISILPLPDKDIWQAKYCRWHTKCVKG